jgi:hypothetical protein
LPFKKARWLGGTFREGKKLSLKLSLRSRRIPLRLTLTFSLLEGTMCAWVPPPPGNRLFYAFVAPPHLELSAKPEVRTASSLRSPRLWCRPRMSFDGRGHRMHSLH